MGIYNCADTLPQAIDSILAQTETDWELILCDDGSSDCTYAVAEEYARRDPERIVLLRNPKNLGLNATLNRCLKAARASLCLLRLIKRHSHFFVTVHVISVCYQERNALVVVL